MKSPIAARQREDALLQCRGIGVSFGGVRAVDAVSLSVTPGEILGLIGPNGAGKTTLINAITGVVNPDTGSVKLNGVELTGRGSVHAAKQGVSRTFQAARLFGGLTVFENLLVGARRPGVRESRAQEIARSYLTWSGIEKRAEVRANSLSYGEERILALARALVQKPSVLLLDEPAAGMAEAETDHLAELIVSIKTDVGIGVLLIEHDMRLVMGVCDRLHVLENGSTLAVGDPLEVRNNPDVISAYLGSAAANRGSENA